MNTPAHIIFGAAAFARPGRPWVSAAAVLGGLLPDLSLYLLAGWHLLWLATPPEVVFGELYFSDGWTRLFRIDNSIVLWSIGLALGLWRRNAVVVALAGAALLHLALDLPLHHDDGRPHFWPLTDWVFVSPLSYWDPRHHGGHVGPVETLASLALCVVLWRRFAGLWPRLAVVAAALSQLAPLVLWALVFAG
ncbi:cobyric acid synthase [Oceanicola granulosus HTCC2516]|uniref:Cobyric acid synthase n=1 Tax=Oceanicola granulosus (strain ATCC BAA-861 / DSM 15982 / KCTC 12143 / HTCC2516) TaxID=314256 RepID=Q2CAB3_OCEGH|nr:hypothetical protein [Oceanicola granulosus]EAR49605.1 cobyric acid synthase [Oceanicola granulosus HTCC2516]